MDVILVGLPGSGKSVVGKRLAARHGAAYIDLDERIEQAAGRPIPDIFADDGEAAFRELEQVAVASLGPPNSDRLVRRVVATGGGAVVDPRNRWRLYRGRLPIWLDGRPEVLAQRLRRSPNLRPLVAGGDPIGAVRALAVARERFYAAGRRVASVAEVPAVVAAVDGAIRDAAAATDSGTALVRAETTIGRYLLGEGLAASGVDEALRRLGARRAIVVSEPGARAAVGDLLEGRLVRLGWSVVRVELPRGEAAKTMSAVEAGARALARLRVERGEPLVAVGGGALGDAAGFLAATYQRGMPLVHVPTTLVAQIDSSIGGKTAVDLPEGKNLVGAFHQPAAIVIDIAFLASLPERERRAALGEATKMAALGDERLFALLEVDGAAIASGEPGPVESGALAELVERAGWAKVEVVTADEREAGLRLSLNLGHSLGHAVEAAGGYRDLLHGEAVAYGLRAAARIGQALGVTPPDRASRIERLLDAVGLAQEPLPYPVEIVLEALAADKKHAGGRLRWVLPTADGHTIRDDVPADVVREAAARLLRPPVEAGAR